MGLRDIGSTLPPGFRFYPSDEELVCHYLYKKICNEEVLRGTLVEIDLHTCEPWQLPDVAKLNSSEWYFFSFRDRKYATGFRTNRATTSGYWKATGKDRVVVDPTTRAIVGMRKTLVFYKNRAPNGIKTGWIMHEFRLESPHVPPKEDWVLCRVFHKSRTEGENTTSYNNYESNATGATSPNLATSPTNEHTFNMPNNNTSSYNYYQDISTSNFPYTPSSHHQHGQNPSTSLGLSVLDLHMNINDHYQNHNLTLSRMIDQNAKCEDDYGFLFDMSFDQSINGGVEDMRFDDDHNGSVFI